MSYFISFVVYAYGLVRLTICDAPSSDKVLLSSMWLIGLVVLFEIEEVKKKINSK